MGASAERLVRLHVAHETPIERYPIETSTTGRMEPIRREQPDVTKAPATAL